MRPRSIAAIVVAAGKGERAISAAASEPKQYRPLLGIPVLARTISALLRHSSLSFVLPVIHRDHRHLYEALDLSDSRLLDPVVGGATRQASVLEGLKHLAQFAPDLVLIHDAARPFVDQAMIDEVINGLSDHDGALAALAVTDTLKRSSDGINVVGTEDRSTLFSAQTPQGFRFPQLLSAHMRAANLPREFTDDAQIAEWAGLRVALTRGSVHNIKLTFAQDFARAEQMLTQEQPLETRVGSGFDVHPFEPGDAVWLGGVRIPFTKRLKGHSDADVALHALTDALYGAMGKGDIGVHFPPSDPQWKGAASSIFLVHAAEMVAAVGGRIVNLDVTLVCEAPKISPHVPQMREKIAQCCKIDPTRVAIKATTSERLGFTGREEGIVAMATASIEVPRR